MVWVHPYQTRISTMDGTVKQLAQLASLGPTGPMPWCAQQGRLPCAPFLKWVPECHVRGEYQQCSLQNDLAIRGLPNLDLSSWVVYPEGLNGCQVLVIMHST